MRRKPSKRNMVQMETIKQAPASQGKFRIDVRTELEIPANLTPDEVEKWKQKMIDKYTNYDKKNAKARLTGGATVSSKLLKPTKEI